MEVLTEDIFIRTEGGNQCRRYDIIRVDIEEANAVCQMAYFGRRRLEDGRRKAGSLRIIVIFARRPSHAYGEANIVAAIAEFRIAAGRKRCGLAKRWAHFWRN